MLNTAWTLEANAIRMMEGRDSRAEAGRELLRSFQNAARRRRGGGVESASASWVRVLRPNDAAKLMRFGVRCGLAAHPLSRAGRLLTRNDELWECRAICWYGRSQGHFR